MLIFLLQQPLQISKLYVFTRESIWDRKVNDTSEIFCRFTRNLLSNAEFHHTKVCYRNISNVSSNNNDLDFAIIYIILRACHYGPRGNTFARITQERAQCPFIIFYHLYGRSPDSRVPLAEAILKIGKRVMRSDIYFFIYIFLGVIKFRCRSGGTSTTYK